MIGFIFEYYKYVRYTKESLKDLQEIMNSEEASKSFLTFGEYDRLKVNCVTKFRRFRDLSSLAKNWIGNRQSFLLYSLEDEPSYMYKEEEDEFGFVEKTSREYDQHLFLGLTEVTFRSGLRDKMESYCELINEVKSEITQEIAKFEEKSGRKLSYMFLGNLGIFGISILWFVDQYTDVLQIANYIKSSLACRILSVHTIFSKNPHGIKDKIEEIEGTALVQFTLKKALRKEMGDLKQQLGEDAYYTSGPYDVIKEIPANKIYKKFEEEEIFNHSTDAYQSEIFQTSIILSGKIQDDIIFDGDNKSFHVDGKSFGEKIEEIKRKADSIRGTLKKEFFETAGIVDIFDSLLCDYRYNVISTENEHWAEDFSYVFLKSLESLEDMIKYYTKHPDYDMELLDSFRIVLNNLKQEIFHMAESKDFDFEIPKCHLRYTGQEDNILFAYMNIIKEILKEAYCLSSENSQTEIVPIVTVDTVPIIKSQIYFDKSSLYKDNLQEKDQKVKMLMINLPHVSFYDIPSYIRYLYHEIYHYIVPNNREKRDIYIGKFVTAIFYQDIVEKLLEVNLKEEVLVDIVTEFIKIALVQFAMEKYCEIHEEMKVDYGIHETDTVFFIREVYIRNLLNFLKKDVMDWTKGEDSIFGDIIENLSMCLSQKEIKENLKEISYENLKKVIINKKIDKPIEKYEDIQNFIEECEHKKTHEKYSSDILLSAKESKEKCEFLVDGIKEAAADIPMIELTDMQLEEYLLTYIVCQKNLLRKPEDITQGSREPIRIAVVLYYYFQNKKVKLNEEICEKLRIQYYAQYISIYGKKSKDEMMEEVESVGNEFKKWWQSFYDINNSAGEEIFLFYYDAFKNIIDELSVENRKNNSSTESFKAWFNKYRKNRINYGKNLLTIRRKQSDEDFDFENMCKETMNTYEDGLFKMNIELIQNFQKYRSLEELVEIREKNEKEKKKTKLESQDNSLYITVIRGSLEKEKNEINEYKTTVSNIDGLMREFEKITKKLKTSCYKVLPKRNYSLWYRGQTNSQYELLPLIMRPGETGRQRFNYLAQYQRYLFEEFKYRADGSPEIINPAQYSVSDYLALMQHYGVGTNLLDWSEDAFTSLYFALETLITGKHREVWHNPSIQIFSPHLYNRARVQMSQGGLTSLADEEEVFRASMNTIKIYTGEIPNIAARHNEDIFNMFLLGDVKYENSKKYGYSEEIFLSGGRELAFLPLAVHTSRLNPRIRSQSGMFLAYNLYVEPSELDVYQYMSLEKIQEYYLKQCKARDKQQFLYKIVIDKDGAKSIADCFISLGLSKERIYPELSNIGFSIK